MERCRKLVAKGLGGGAWRGACASDGNQRSREEVGRSREGRTANTKAQRPGEMGFVRNKIIIIVWHG